MEAAKYHNRLKRWLDSRSIEYEHLIFTNSCHSIQEAVAASDKPIEYFVKNICMISDNSEFIVAIVLGEDRASTSRVAKALQINKPRLATPQEILEHTGYKIGGVPSLSYSATFLIDPKVTNREYIITGGGSEYALLKLKVDDLLKNTDATIVRVRK